MTMRLSDERYEQIKHLVLRTFRQHKIDEIPVNPWNLARSMGIELKKYSSLSADNRKFLTTQFSGGLSWRVKNPDGKSSYVIFYDDLVPIGRQRFTILHEIGHIVLRHHQDSGLADTEADFFAKYAIAPPVLIHVFGRRDYSDIAFAFGLSAECARNSLNYYNRWRRRRREKYTDYEYELVEIFAKKSDDGSFELRRRCNV